MEVPPPAHLIIVADDYGYTPAYDDGILDAARVGALDAVGVMVLRDPDPTQLLESGVEIGLHLELDNAPLDAQLESFRAIFRTAPAYLDGHHHCHAQAGRRALEVARLGVCLGVPVRSVNARHRRLLRCLGAPTAERLIGRLSEDEPALPGELDDWLAGRRAPVGVVEWMVHPGHPDPRSSSDYDRGRGEDLALLLELGNRDRWRDRGITRAGPGEALGAG